MWRSRSRAQGIFIVRGQFQVTERKGGGLDFARIIIPEPESVRVISQGSHQKDMMPFTALGSLLCTREVEMGTGQKRRKVIVWDGLG